MAEGESPNAAPVDGPFVITRTFDAPRTLMFKAWSEADHLMRWFGPKGITMLSCKVDLRPGGMFHYGMRTPDGKDMWGRWIFREIASPERLVFVVSFSDAQGGVTRHPFAPEWPLETLSRVTFAEQARRTAVTVEWSAHNPTLAERQAFAAGHAGMQQGWTGTLDQLEAYLGGMASA